MPSSPVIEESADAPATIEDADELQTDENILPPVAVEDAEQPQVDDNIPPPAAVEDAEEPLSVEVTEAPVPIESADTPVAVEDSDQPQISDAPPAAQAVQDLVAPAVVVPADITMDTEPGQNYATVQYSQPTARDNVGVVSDPILIAGLSSGNAFPVGTMTVTYQASDSAGNIGAASFNVTIRDAEAPVVTLPADITLNADSGQDYAVVSYGEPIATDNVGVALGPTLVAGLYSGSQFPVGTTSVTYEASDASGNTGIGSFVVTVERAVQNQAPTRPFISRF